MVGRSIHLERAYRASRFAIVFAVLLAVMGQSRVLAQSSPQAEDDNPIIQKYRQLIPKLMAEQAIPGLAVAVADDTGVLWSEGFGFTDNDHKIPITPDTIFSVQSISKNFTAAAILLAVQEGLLDLDAPITTYLPDFTVHSIFEEHPERKITLRMLLSHTAGFTHEAPLGNNFDLGPVAFEEHIKTISDTWLRFPVGTGYAYSNLGISLAGYILQKVTGVPFAQFVEEKLLHPVGMVNSSFDMAQIRANPNRAIGHSGSLPKVPLEIPIIPEGGLYASANDMAKYIGFHLNRGSVNGQNLLNPALLDEMYTVPAPAQDSSERYALGVARTHWHKNRETELLLHGGGGFGFLADLVWCPELKIGITVLTNSADHKLQTDLAVQILNDLVRDPNRVYYSRMMALPARTSVSDSQSGLPLGLVQAIEQHALQPSDRVVVFPAARPHPPHPPRCTCRQASQSLGKADSRLGRPDQPFRLVEHRYDRRHPDDHLLWISRLVGTAALAKTSDAHAIRLPGCRSWLPRPECAGLEKSLVVTLGAGILPNV